MRRRLVYRSCLIVLFTASVVGILILAYLQMDKQIPDSIHLLVNRQESFDFSMPIEADIEKEDIQALSVSQEKLDTNTIHFDFNRPFTMESSVLGTYEINLKLFGLIDYKKIDVTVIDEQYIIPGGESIGIYIESDGILVLGTSSIMGADGLNYEPSLEVLFSGDYITAVNNKRVENKDQFIELIQKIGAKELSLKVRRDGREKQIKVKPVKTLDGDYKIGAWIRDDTQGIGTMTYMDLKGDFGALGHGITDVDTNLLMEIEDGIIYNADILEIIKGQNGVPGEIVGVIRTSRGNDIGTVEKNTNQGIFGALKKENCPLYDKTKALPIGLKQEVKCGKATILCSVEGEVEEYQINIIDIELNNKNLNKGLVIEITDPRLLQITNGIVQGMSGSPIIQNGKLIGAVTHVFIQDSTKGYGTFIENMLKTGNG